MSEDQTRKPPPATPLRLVSDQGERVLPTNAAAEQRLLGALFIDNRAYQRVEGLLRADHFSWSVHGRIYTAIGQMVATGKKANPASLKHIFEVEEALRLHGGAKYLMQLAKAAVTVNNVEQYAEIIADLAHRRALIAATLETLDDAYVVTLDRNTAAVFAALEARLEAVRAAAPRNERDRPIDVLEFLELRIPAREMVIAPWLPTKGLAMITGKAGVGKTMLGLQLAWGIATAQPPIDGWMVPTPRRVLYVEGEMAPVDLQDRLRAVRGGLPLEPAAGFFNAIFADQPERARGVPDLSTLEGQAWLAPQIGDAEVIVVDSITTLMPTQDQNEGHDWASSQVWLLELRRRGLSVIMIHHNNKSGAQNGTERRMVPLDTAIDLSRPPGYRASEGARFIVEYIKNRGFSGADAEPFELTYRIGPKGEAMWQRGPVRSAEAAEHEALKTRIEELVAERKSQRDIATLLGISIGKVQRTLKNGAITDTEH